MTTHAPRIVVLGLLLVASLTWMLERSFAPVVPYGVTVEQALHGLDIADRELGSDILAARAGLLQNYDPLVDDIEAMHREVAALRQSHEGTGARGRALAKAINDKESLLEQFKSENAVLQNALATFDLLSARLSGAPVNPNLALAVGSLASLMAHMSRQPSAEVARAATSWVDALSDLDFGPDNADTAASLGSHGRLLVDIVPRVDDLLNRLRSLSFAPETDAIASDLRREREEQGRVSAWFHWALYGTALVVSALLLRAGLGLQSRTAALQARIAIETAILKASSLFVACPPEEIDGRLDEALALLGQAQGVERAYMIRGDLQRARLWTRPGSPPPVGWPESRFALPAIVRRSMRERVCTRASDSKFLGELAATLDSEGITSFACTAFGAEDTFGILAFEGATPDAGTSGEVSLELMAEVLAGAVSRRDAERRRQELERKLRRAERLQSLGTFASGIAHNFNNLLGVIIGQTEMAAVAPDAGPLVARHVREIADAGQRAREIAEQILDFGRNDQRAPKPLDLAAVVSEAVRQVEATAHGRCTFAVAGVDHHGGMVLADATQLGQVLVNVIQNAVQASAEGVSVAVTLDEAQSPGEQLSHGSLEAGHYLRVTVSDMGRGMTAPEVTRMFEPFFTTRDNGTGLGLATARDTVAEMGGAFEVRSKPGVGTTVTIWLPRVVAQVDGTSGVVLLLGRDRVSVERDEELLAAIGYEPVGFTEAELALQALRKDTNHFDLAIVDQTVLAAEPAGMIKALRAALPNRQPILLSIPEGEGHLTPEGIPGIAAVLLRPWRSGHVASTIALLVRR